MKNSKALWGALTVIVLMWAVTAWYYQSLPQSMPVHWGLTGEADRYMDKPWGALILPLVATGLLVLLWAIPYLAPKGFRLDSARDAYGFVVLAITVFELFILVVTYEKAIGRDLDIQTWVFSGISVLFIVLGNYISKFPKNFFVGIRTPWTLSSDEVWFKTHRLAGRLFVLAGFMGLAAAWLRWPVWLWIALISLAALIPVIYSLVLYKKTHGFSPEELE